MKSDTNSHEAVASAQRRDCFTVGGFYAWDCGNAIGGLAFAPFARPGAKTFPNRKILSTFKPLSQ